MSGQMCWLSSSGNEGKLILHLRKRSFDPWLPYTAYPQYKVADYHIENGSNGFSTCQKLRQAGWTLIPTPQAQNISQSDLVRGEVGKTRLTADNFTLE
jgi:hypothetical protein